MTSDCQHIPSAVAVFYVSAMLLKLELLGGMLLAIDCSALGDNHQRPNTLM